MTKTKLIIEIIIPSLLSGCASEESRKAYVSPLELKDYSCNQIVKETAYTTAQLNKANTENILGAAVAEIASTNPRRSMINVSAFSGE